VKAVFGWEAVFYLMAGCFASVTLLEIINYIRHYGLLRDEIKPGVYEQVNISHSWNASFTVQNSILLKLQRHSDHHANAYKPYQALATYDESP
jgi:alkane 1-monooxygenase